MQHVGLQQAKRKATNSLHKTCKQVWRTYWRHLKVSPQ